MTRRLWPLLLAASLLAAAALLLPAQRPSAARPAEQHVQVWETKVLAPREITPAHYAQVTQRDLDQANFEGWELVSVTPYTLRNEARGAERDTITQVYAAYYFKRLKPDR